jgi:hypothetical protein
MVPNLAESQHQPIRDMILNESLTKSELANIAGCSDRTIQNTSSNVRLFGKKKAPANDAGRQQLVIPPMLAALCDRLIEKPGLYRDEVVVFLYDEFDILVSLSSISGALVSIKWTKVTQYITNERNANLCDIYSRNLSAFQSYQFVYINECWCDKRIGFRRTGWSPLRVAPVGVARFHGH